MPNSDAQFQYVEGQARPTFAALLAGYEALGAAAIRSQPCTLDIPYGAGERQVFDFFTARGEPQGTLMYFHAGYWQSRDRSTFRFIAPAFTQHGLNVALVNYPLCPMVSLAGLTEVVRASVPKVLAHAAGLGQPECPLIASGHSAGGHLAVELALSRWPELGVRARAVDGVIALSGIYDLAPLVTTSLNAKLGLDAAAARANSPLHRVATGLPPALFVVGGDETPAFLEQCRHMHEAWQGAGNRSAIEIVPEADHFSLLQSFSSPGSTLFGKVSQLLLAQQRFSRQAIG